MKKAFVVVLTLVLCLSVLAGCGGGGASSGELKGKYVLTAIDVDGIDALEMMESMGLKASDTYYEFSDDGTFKMSLMGYEEEGTFKADGKKITLTVDGEDSEVTFDGKKITFEEIDEGEKTKMVFEKK